MPSALGRSDGSWASSSPISSASHSGVVGSRSSSVAATSDGRWLLEQVRESRPTLRRIMCSGGHKMALQHSLSTGVADRVLSKPLQRETVIAALVADDKNDVG